MSKKSRYSRYLRSNNWRCFREAILRKFKKCSICGSTERLHLHHLTYENFGREDIKDVAVMCENCHNKLHKIFQYPTKKEYYLFKETHNPKKYNRNRHYKNKETDIIDMKKAYEKIIKGSHKPREK